MIFFISLLISVYGILPLNAFAIEKPDQRIINGYKAKPEDFPYHVALSFIFEANDTILASRCGGSLLNSKSVLTAAHCHPDGFIEGDASFGSDKYMQGEIVVFTKVTIHEDYNKGRKYANDIAIVHLDKDMNSNGVTIDFITLDTNMVPNSLQVNVSGFGKISDTELSNDFFYAELQSLSNDVCEARFGHVLDSMLCLQGLTTQATCGGDSGGAAVHYDDNKKGKALQVGILSFGYKNCTQEYPEIFTRVSSYIDWIHTHW